MRWYVLRRLAFAVLTIYLVLSITFVFFAFTPDPNRALVQFQAAMAGESGEEAVSRFNEIRNYDEPILERYVDWMIGYATFDWGFSWSRGAPVLDVIVDRLAVTLAYFVPAMALSVAGGILVGLYSAARRNTLPDYLVTVAGYLGVSVPHFVVAELLVIVHRSRLDSELIGYDPELPMTAAMNAHQLGLAALVLAATMLAGQMRYTRAESLDRLNEAFVKTARAKGAGSRRVARHVLRNAAVPLLTLLVTDLFSMLILAVYVVEVVFEIPGVAALSYQAILDRDIGLIFGTAMIPITVAVFGNLLQDLAYTALDPRVEYGS